eukprot:CAMPEP_0170450284 /NCGR_PEP_ID=MMETSP0117_2-20130122/51690_1 /TAXON_ID=400756 /ORGANISM="Durinskia baltica, Strain CSIRO CS-38" /LENGTH=170 /DNA_ID=CAMNT_0010711571 /DNA_START=22 /DNA_END=535 /DNA_ORIENTATION=+
MSPPEQRKSRFEHLCAAPGARSFLMPENPDPNTARLPPWVANTVAATAAAPEQPANAPFEETICADGATEESPCHLTSLARAAARRACVAAATVRIASSWYWSASSRTCTRARAAKANASVSGLSKSGTIRCNAAEGGGSSSVSAVSSRAPPMPSAAVNFDWPMPMPNFN